MDFGVFDHLDRNELPLNAYYESRLQFCELYERFGFYAYHLAEHHSTPLGMAPSPNVFLAAVAQRTRRLRFGPLVYALPLHNPLRLIEEIAMLDQLSGGRLDMGFGRGASPIEIRLYGQPPEKAQGIYNEGVEIVLQGLSKQLVDFHGEFFSYDHVPIELEPFQKPHPPLWYGVHSVDSAERAARLGFHVVSLDSATKTRPFFTRYDEIWAQSTSRGQPKRGIGRFVVVADTDETALRAARRAYPIWHRSFTHLFRIYGGAPVHGRPPDFDGAVQTGQAIAGSPDSVTEAVRAQVNESGANYFVGQFAFGDLSQAETSRSIHLFAEKVMPAFDI
ncbi:MAG TPA: LLM class flavin-dependent oxidoreductase [Candidatus Binatia bacterium]|jgi:alkanesulfonate monooxygenase SsuD/methylene tetrahydromethanopterin reductase-like flavin-dependent oxidoreductase (luciferase family)